MKAIKFEIPKMINTICMVQEDKQPYFYDSMHQHTELQITCILSGTGTLLIGDYMGKFKPGDLIVIGENQPHVFKSNPDYYEGKEALISWAISLFFNKKILNGTFSKLEELKEVETFIRKAKRGLKINGVTRKSILPIMKKMVKIKGLDKFTSFFDVIRLLAQCQNTKVLSSETLDYEIGEEAGKRLNDVINFTFNQYHRPINLKEVAEVAAMAPGSFCRFFKQRTRKTYFQFLTEIRIQKACRLLRDKESSILEICFKCGFNTISNFNKRFKALKGCTPSEYQERNYIQ